LVDVRFATDRLARIADDLDRADLQRSMIILGGNAVLV
jgi:hypothetical protein